MNKRLEKFSKLIEQRRLTKADKTLKATADVQPAVASAPVTLELPAVEEPAPVTDVTPEEPVPVEAVAPVEESPVEVAAAVPAEPVTEEPVVSETPNRSRNRRGKKSKDSEE